MLVTKLSTFNRIKISTLPHIKECHNTPTCVIHISQHSQSISIISLIQTLLHLVLASGLITCGFLSNTEGTSHPPYIQHASSILSYSIGLHQHQLVVVQITKLLTIQYCRSSCWFNFLPNILLTLPKTPNFTQQSGCLPTFKINTLPPLTGLKIEAVHSC